MGIGGKNEIQEPVPLHSWLLEMDKETQRQAERSKVIKTLRGVLAGEALHPLVTPALSSLMPPLAFD